MIAQTRTDLFLAKITGEDVALPVPQTRFELYLANIAGESYELPAPNSRATLYLAKILGQDVELPEPQTRSELYLASIAGMSVQLPEAPQTREEWYLARWAEDAGYVVITGNPVSFNAVAAALRQLKVAFAPVQDLHGYNSPWPAAGGKNKITPIDVTTTNNGVSVVASASAETITLTDEATGSGGRGFRLTNLCALKAGSYVLSVTGEHSGNYIVQDSNGNVYISQSTFTLAEDTTVFVGVNVTAGVTYNETVKLQIETGSTPTAWTPYSNECPISGWTGVNVWQRGINLWDEEWEVGLISYETGEKVPDAAGDDIRSFFISVAEGESYYCALPTTAYCLVWGYDSDKNPTSRLHYGLGNVTINVPVGTKYIMFCTDRGYGATYHNDISINYPSTDHEYHAYDPASQLIQVVFPDGETYYSGWVDPTTGDGLATTKAVDMGDLGWTAATSADARVFYAELKNIGGKVISGTFYGLCSRYARKESLPYLNGHFIMYGSTAYGGFSRCGIRDDAYSEATATEFKASVAGQILVFELETPIPFHVDPQQINSLVGTNTMWTDAGPMTVEYRKDGNVSDVEALSILLGGRYTPAQTDDDVPDAEALRIITGGNR